MNMLFGNSSLQPDVELIDVEVPAALARVWGGPNQGIAGMRRHTGAFERPLTCTALKPIGSTIEALAHMCSVFARAGIDVIKDDHGWANQRSAPFAERVRACQQAVAAGNAARSRGRTLYAPSLYGHHDEMRAQIELARREGVRLVLIAPMVCGVATLVALKREFDDMMFIAHPSLGGLRIAPAGTVRKTVSPVRCRRGDLSESRRPIFLFARGMPCDCQAQHAAVARLERRPCRRPPAG